MLSLLSLVGGALWGLHTRPCFRLESPLKQRRAGHKIRLAVCIIFVLACCVLGVSIRLGQPRQEVGWYHAGTQLMQDAVGRWHRRGMAHGYASVWHSLSKQAPPFAADSPTPQNHSIWLAYDSRTNRL